MRKGVESGLGIVVGASLAALLGAGCRSMEGLPLEDTNGNQWVWPYFVRRQPTVLAFWNIKEIRCVDDMPALMALQHRDSSVDLVSVFNGDERMKAEMWMRKQGADYTVLLDPDAALARRLKVTAYPTYVFFDMRGEEITRSADIRAVHQWFDRDHWLRRAMVGQRGAEG